MNLDLSLRVAGISPSATLSVDARVKALKAEGRDVIGFGAGEPDFATPAHIVEAAVQACRDPRNHRYSPTAGLPELREAISAKTLRDSGLQVDPLDVLVTNGGKHAVEQAFATLLNPGDEVLLPAPYWTTYPEAIRLAGGTPVVVATDADSGFKVDPVQLEAHRTENTKLLVLCSPSNPTGSVYSAEELAAIGAWLVSAGIWVLADEIYEHFVYTGDVAPSLPVVSPEVRGQCVIVNGVAKSYAMTGWRVGWVVAPRAVIAAATNLQSHTTSNVSNVPQHAAIAALSGPLDGVHEMREAFRRRRQLTVEMLRDVAGFTCAMPDGAFYAFPSVAGLIGRNLHGSTVQSSIDVAGLMLDTCGVAAVPGEAFGAPGHLRFSYALSDDEIVNGLSRLAQEFGNSAT